MMMNIHQQMLRGITLMAIALLSYAYQGCKKKNNEPPKPPGGSSPTASTSPDFKYSGDLKPGSQIQFYSLAVAKSEEWNFGDGTTQKSVSTLTSPTIHTYSTPGTYEVSLKLDGDTGRVVKKTLTIKSIYNYGFYWTGTPVVGDTIYFHFNWPVPADSNYSWTFGDGSTGTGTTPWHVYTSPQNYLVNLYVNGSYRTFLWNGLTIYKDPIYTSHIAGTRIWHNYRVVKGNTYPGNDTTLTITYLNKVKLSALFTEFTYNPDMSTNDELYYTSQQAPGWPLNKIYYNRIKDSTSISYRTVSGGLGTPPVEVDNYWHTP